MSDIKPLNIFFGRIPDSEFLEDLNHFLSLNEKEGFELIDKVIDWYPRQNIDKEWEEWSKKFNEDEEEKRSNKESPIYF